MTLTRPLAWPWPLWIAHRGGGSLAPENTLSGFRLGARRGYRMFECDARLSADGVVFLMHDDTLDRSTSGQGPAIARPWSELSRLDAGSWFSPEFAGERLPRLQQVLDWCLEHGLALNIEIKPSEGTERATGAAVAREVAAHALGQRSNTVLLTSFQTQALDAARDCAVHIPRGLLQTDLDDTSLPAALALECVALVAHYPQWQTEWVSRVHAAGLAALAYTVNAPEHAQLLIDMQLDGIITDRLNLFRPDAPLVSGASPLASPIPEHWPPAPAHRR